VADLRAGAFFVTLAFGAAALLVGFASFLVGLVLLLDRAVTMTAFFAGAFAAAARLGMAFGLADLVLSVLLFTGLEVVRLVVGLRIPFVMGLLMETVKGQGLNSKFRRKKPSEA